MRRLVSRSKSYAFLLHSGEFDYELHLRYDLYTKRNTQWFYFRLQNIRAEQRYRFTIVNFFKVSSRCCQSRSSVSVVLACESLR